MTLTTILPVHPRSIIPPDLLIRAAPSRREPSGASLEFALPSRGNVTIQPVAKLVWLPFVLILVACSAPKKEVPPALTPGGAASLLHYNAKAETWLNHVKRTD